MRQSRVLVTCAHCGAKQTLPAIAVFHIGKYKDEVYPCTGCSYCFACKEYTDVRTA